MERVDHVHIVQVGSSRLVCHVDRMFQRKIPYREGLELGITRLHTLLVFLIELAQANSHLTATRTRSRNNYQRTSGFYIVVLSETFIRVNQSYIVWITFDGIMTIDLDAETFQAVLVSIRARLAIIVSDDYPTGIQSYFFEFIAQTENILIVSDTEITSHLVLFNIKGTDDHDNFCTITELHEHTQLAIRKETRQHAAGMVIIEQFTPKFKVQLIAELRDALFDSFGLYLEILFVIKTYSHIFSTYMEYKVTISSASLKVKKEKIALRELLNYFFSKC